MLGWVIWFYVWLSIVTVATFAWWHWGGRIWRMPSWVSLLCWVPAFGGGYALLAVVTNHYFYAKDSLGPYPWTGWPHMTVWRWILVGIVVFFGITAFILARSRPHLSRIALFGAALFLAWFVLLAWPFITWWMWLILFLGVVTYLITFFVNVRILHLLVKLFALLLALFAVFGLNWLAGTKGALTSSVLAAPKVSCTDNKDLTTSCEVMHAPKGLAYVWKIYQINQGSFTEVTGVLGADGPQVKSGALPKAGDYKVSVYGEQGNARRTETGTTKVTVTGPGGQAQGNKPTTANGCQGTWAYDMSAHPDYAWVEGGLQSVYKAFQTKSEADARAAANDWVDHVKTVLPEWQYAIQLTTHEVVSAGDLEDSGCATTVAADYVTQVKDVLAKSKVTAGQVPSNAYTTGYENGRIVRNATPGITGDRTALIITLPDGTVIYIQAPCGNAASVERPELPVGHTTETPIAQAAGPSQTPGQPASSSSAPQPRSSSSAPQPSAHPSSAAPQRVPTSSGKNAALATQGPVHAGTAGEAHPAGSTAATTTAAPASATVAMQQEESHAVPPSGTATPTAANSGNNGGVFPAG